MQIRVVTVSLTLLHPHIFTFPKGPQIQLHHLPLDETQRRRTFTYPQSRPIPDHPRQRENDARSGTSSDCAPELLDFEPAGEQ